jgi:hypothetical protein
VCPDGCLLGNLLNAETDLNCSMSTSSCCCQLRSDLTENQTFHAFGRRVMAMEDQLPRIALHRSKIALMVRKLDLGLRNVAPKIVEDTNVLVARRSE